MRFIIWFFLTLAAWFAMQAVDGMVAATPTQPAPVPSPAATDSGNRPIPLLAQSYAQAAITKAESGDYQGAIEQFTLAIEAYPGYTDAYRGRAVARDAIGDYKDAADDFTQVLAQAPNDADAFSARGEDRYRLGDYAGADADFSAYLKQNPNNANALTGRGYARAKEGDAAGAAADFRRAVKLDPNNVDVRTSLASADVEMHDVKAASSDLDAAIRVNPKSTGLIKMRMQLRMMMGDTAGALDDARRLIKSGAGDPKTYDMVCTMEADALQYQEALTTCSQAVKLQPNDAFAYATLERVNRMLNRDSAALDDLNAIVRLSPKSGEAYYRRALFEEDHGDRKAAISDYRTALKLYKLAGDTPHVQQIETILRERG